ncbi:hypothetical protein HJFPF1_08638 [Paramyrothecium foliicola]|nr:hypothetical protein HJFPF1_08638 [Paramyrothecium foliicola]
MGPILSVSTKIEIQASPAVVRSVVSTIHFPLLQPVVNERREFMNFAGYKQWQPSWNIASNDAEKQPLDLKAGDRLVVDMDGKVHQPIVVENSPAAFKWEGSFFGLGSGVHQFHFTPSEENPGGTTFVQGEDFRGILITLSSPWWKSKEFDMSPWDKFNSCLKQEVEKAGRV